MTKRPAALATVSQQHAMLAAAEAARRHGIADPVEPLREGANHVFRAGDAIVRVAPRSADVAGQVALARRLVADGFPVAAPLADVELVQGTKVSLWEYVRPSRDRPIDFRQLGEVVARLHRVPPARLTDVVALPFCGDAAWLSVESRLADARAAGLAGPDALAALRRACERLRGWRDRTRQEAQVVCHGDVHPLNVVMRCDEVVLVDWDSICSGPRAWDHAALMTWPERWGGAQGTYRDFARGYGADLSESPLGRELAELRLLAATFNVLLAGAGSPRHAAEAEARLSYWLGDPVAPQWTPL